LVNGGNATLTGKFEPVSILGRKAVHLIATSDDKTENFAGIVLPRVSFRTISFWFYITRIRSNRYVPFLLDGRANSGSNESLILGGGIYWGECSVFVNGGDARYMWDVFDTFNEVSTSWQHMTLVYKLLQPSTVLTLFSRFTGQEAMDINIGMITVYDRELNSSENRANYRAGF
jgi:hypothetical protein